MSAVMGPRPYFSLYELVATDGTVLYVGATTEIGTRLRDHRRNKEWWHEVAYVRVVECVDAQDLHDREIDRIRNLRPRYNQRLRGYDLVPVA